MANILEFGSHTLKFGSAGDHRPSTIYTSNYGSPLKPQGGSPLKRKRTSQDFHFGSPEQLLQRNVDIKSIFHQNHVRDWQTIEAAFEAMLTSPPPSSLSSTSPSIQSLPILLVEPLLIDRLQQQRTVELLFEKFKIPALGAVKCTSAGVFANGRTSALALDIGHSFTSVVPVKDGFTDESKLFRTELAGAVLTEASLELLKATIRTRKTGSNDLNVAFGTAEMQSSSQIHFGALQVATRWKEFCCSSSSSSSSSNSSSTTSTSSTTSSSSSSSSSSPNTSSFTLPDGTKIAASTVSSAAVTELLFDPSLETFFNTVGINSPEKLTGHLGNISRMENMGKILFQSLTQFDGETRRSMWENIVLFGGTSVAQGMSQSIKRELAPLLPKKAVVKIVQTKPGDRVIGSWIGGSIVGSTTDFVSNLCLTKAKYEEEGVDRALLLQEVFQ